MITNPPPAGRHHTNLSTDAPHRCAESSAGGMIHQQLWTVAPPTGDCTHFLIDYLVNDLIDFFLCSQKQKSNNTLCETIVGVDQLKKLKTLHNA